jgi:hypothetical protein
MRVKASLSSGPDRRKPSIKHWNLSNPIFGGGKSACGYLVSELDSETPGGLLMRFIFGVFVGAALMLGSAFLHDKGVVRAGPKQPFVNWDTVMSMLAR